MNRQSASQVSADHDVQTSSLCKLIHPNMYIHKQLYMRRLVSPPIMVATMSNKQPCALRLQSLLCSHRRCNNVQKCQHTRGLMAPIKPYNRQRTSHTHARTHTHTHIHTRQNPGNSRNTSLDKLHRKDKARDNHLTGERSPLHPFIQTHTHFHSFSLLTIVPP